MDPAVTAAISRIPEQDLVGIEYPQAIFDEDEGQWNSDAEVADIGDTAFTSRRKSEHVTARLIVRRVRRLSPATAPAGQDEVLTAYQHHAVFTDSPLGTLEAGASHRDHAIVEQVIADLEHGPLAHLPSGVFTANAAWLVCAAMAFNLTRTAGVTASRTQARARTATFRAQLIQVPARIANHARKWRLHLPTAWPWQAAWESLYDRAHGTATAIACVLPLTAREGPPVAKPGRPANPAHPEPEIADSIPISSPGNHSRRIQVQRHPWNDMLRPIDRTDVHASDNAKDNTNPAAVLSATAGPPCS